MDVRDAPVVALLGENRGNNPVLDHQLCGDASAGLILANELPTTLMWIEHWPKESTDAGELRPSSWSPSLATRSVRGRPTWGDEGMDRGRYLEEVGPPHRESLGGREGVEKWLSRGTVAMVPRSRRWPLYR